MLAIIPQWQEQQLQMKPIDLLVLLEQCTSPAFSARSRIRSASSWRGLATDDTWIADSTHIQAKKLEVVVA